MKWAEWICLAIIALIFVATGALTWPQPKPPSLPAIITQVDQMAGGQQTNWIITCHKYPGDRVACDLYHADATLVRTASGAPADALYHSEFQVPY